MLRISDSARMLFFPIAMLLIAMISIQSSATLAKTLFPLIGPEGTTALRLLFSALILLVAFRPWRRKTSIKAWRAIIAYGVALGGMNLAFYMALQTIPLGVGVALEFTGPLVVALFSSRRSSDFVWIGLAVLGLYLLLPIQSISTGLDLKGVLLALTAGACWGCYIVFGKSAGSISGSMSVALGSLVAASFTFPLGVWYAGASLFTLEVLPVALLIALFSSALPYVLEMMALTRLPAQTFGTLMSIEPAIAAISGYLFLSEKLSAMQCLALLSIMLASMGTALSAKKRYRVVQEEATRGNKRQQEIS